jgi:hypothetical protein
MPPGSGASLTCAGHSERPRADVTSCAPASGRTPPRAWDSLHLLSVPCGPSATQDPGTRTFMQVSLHAKSGLRPVVVLELELSSSCLGKADPLPALRMLTYSENSRAARSSGARARAGCRGGGEPPGDQPDGECQLEYPSGDGGDERSARDAEQLQQIARGEACVADETPAS